MDLSCIGLIMEELANFDPKLEVFSRLRLIYVEKIGLVDAVIMEYLDEKGGALLPDEDEKQNQLIDNLPDGAYVFATLVTHAKDDNPELAFLLIAYGAALTLTIYGQAPWNRMIELANELDTMESEKPE